MLFIGRGRFSFHFKVLSFAFAGAMGQIFNFLEKNRGEEAFAIVEKDNSTVSVGDVRVI